MLIKLTINVKNYIYTLGFVVIVLLVLIFIYKGKKTTPIPKETPPASVPLPYTGCKDKEGNPLPASECIKA